METLTVSQLVKKFPTVYETQMFIVMFTTCHLSIPRARSFQFILPHLISFKIHSNVLPPLARSSKWSLSIRFPHKTVYAPLLTPVFCRLAISFFLVLSPRFYLVRITYHESLPCIVFSSLLLFPLIYLLIYLFIYIKIDPKRLVNLLDIEEI